MAVVNFVSLFVVTPVVAFYMLLDWDRMVAKIDAGSRAITSIRSAASPATSTAPIAGFVRGQGALCLILGIFYAIGLSSSGSISAC